MIKPKAMKYRIYTYGGLVDTQELTDEQLAACKKLAQQGKNNIRRIEKVEN